EDVPDPGQLRAAAARFRARPSSVACLQARLLIDHLETNWLSLMFGLDYAALFGVIKPGLATLRLPLPLGGTSNHFRTAALRRAGGWDAWNVTEDIDLGFRLARLGYSIEALDSTTYEEAPLTLARWLPQRSRWLKGWMVTLMVHTRQPRRLFRELGPCGGAAVTLSLLGTISSSLLGPLFGPLALYAIWRGGWFSPVSLSAAMAGSASLYLLVAGAASVVWPQFIVLWRLRRPDLLVWSLTLPVYLMLVSVAAWCAVAEVIMEPQRWNKTEHGFAERPSLAEAGTAVAAAADQAAIFHAPRPLSLMS
ncbi:MAG TPA: glycosyltransferase, partial [Lichenihabitans sp.]|nr:glycosyltransferase [Lichenihabitans sp.]